MAVRVGDVAYFVAAIVLTLFALWLLFLSSRQRATRAFAALLMGMASLWSLDFLWEFLSADARWALRSSGGIGAAVIGIATLYFLCVYPRPGGWVGAKLAQELWPGPAKAQQLREEVERELGIAPV